MKQRYRYRISPKHFASEVTIASKPYIWITSGKIETTKRNQSKKKQYSAVELSGIRQCRGFDLPVKKTGLRIPIHFIRIQHFRMNTNPDPDPIRIHGFKGPYIEKKLQLKKN
jgi:hypothetical protein